MSEAGKLTHDAITIGAGVTGIYMLHRLREQGLDATVLEAGDGPGGTWYWNRYPGARFDSESYSYGYSFDKDILSEWNWSEHFAAQPETLEYLNFVTDKLDLRKNMQFGCRVNAARFDEATSNWLVELEDGRTLTCRYLLTAIGMLSAATLPRIKGIETFKGEAHHTYYWPKDDEVDLEGKRVAVIGTGATGVQVISDIAPKVGELTVFQRRPNWCAPLHNSKIDDETQGKIKASYDEIFARLKETHGGFLHGILSRSYDDDTPEERRAHWEKIYSEPGFGVWFDNYAEVLLLPDANEDYSNFIADKIRERVTDRETAEKLIPRDHGFGSRRVPLETRYYEAYNQPNVHLIDVKETPIDSITPTGIKTTDKEHDFDLIIYATGFDAITGAFDRIEFEGVGGQKLGDKWKDGPITSYGLQSHGFPNLFLLAGPQSASVSSNFPPAIEACVNWTSELIAHMDREGLKRVEAKEETEEAWLNDIKESYVGSLLASSKSWFTGYNSNVDGHDKLRHMIFLKGAPAYRTALTEEAESGYSGFTLS